MGAAKKAKRLTDASVAVTALIVLSPLLAGLACAVRLLLGSPVLFTQERVGLGNVPFRIVKFRTMTEARDDEGLLLADQYRLTRFGRFLRSTSLDELPSLWNVVRGDMSLVGPRPLPAAYLPRYTAREVRRHEVRPGITGLAQISGRNAISWDARLELDVHYVDTWSFRGDVRILLRTFGHVLARTGVNADGHATMGELRPPTASAHFKE